MKIENVVRSEMVDIRLRPKKKGILRIDLESVGINRSTYRSEYSDLFVEYFREGNNALPFYRPVKIGVNALMSVAAMREMASALVYLANFMEEKKKEQIENACAADIWLSSDEIQIFLTKVVGRPVKFPSLQRDIREVQSAPDLLGNVPKMTVENEGYDKFEYVSGEYSITVTQDRTLFENFQRLTKRRYNIKFLPSWEKTSEVWRKTAMEALLEIIETK